MLGEWMNFLQGGYGYPDLVTTRGHARFGRSGGQRRSMSLIFIPEPIWVEYIRENL